MNPKKVLTGGDRLRGPNARVSLEQPIIQLQTFVCLPAKKLQRANEGSKLTISKLAQAHDRALGRACSQRFRDNETLKKINERRRKDKLPALTLKLMRGDAPVSSVLLATHSETTEAAIVMRPNRRSSRWGVSHEYTENVNTEVKTEDSPERLTVSFKFHEDKMMRKASMLKKAHRDLAAAQRQLWKLQKEVSRGVTGVLVFLLHCLDYLAYVYEFYQTQITTAMKISRISQYHNVQNGEDTLFKTCRTKYAVAVCRNILLFII